ncbi:hypothetical protein [Morganella morganii]|nr:hypothetical protein [Morganella morganii]
MRYTMRSLSSQQVIHAHIPKSKAHHSHSNRHRHKATSAGQDGYR